MVEKLNNLCEDLDDEEYVAMMHDMYNDLYKAVSQVMVKYRNAYMYKTDFQGVMEDVTDQFMYSADFKWFD